MRACVRYRNAGGCLRNSPVRYARRGPRKPKFIAGVYVCETTIEARAEAEEAAEAEEDEAPHALELSNGLTDRRTRLTILGKFSKRPFID